MAKKNKRGGGKAVALPADLSMEIASTGDGRDITRPFVQELQQPRDPKLWGATDWGVYERIRKDDQVKSCMEQRIRAVVSREWDVLPGDEEDARSVEAAQAFKETLERVGWDLVTEKMLWASFYGISVAELNWGALDGLLDWVPGEKCRAIHVRHARRFRFDRNDRLRLLTRAAPQGEPVPDRKFWVVRAGGTDDDQVYGEGLAEWLYWPTLFKRNGVRFWNIFLDKFSVPTAKGTYPRGSTAKDIDKLLAAIQAIANDSGFAIPAGMDVELLTLAQSGADFAAVCRYMDGCIAKIILSQTMTTDNGSSRAQGEVHADVKLEVVKADADMLSDSFNAGPARWWTDLNYGPDVASPMLVRIVAEEDDLKAAADTDKTLAELGWVRTDESFKDRYGDGYVRKAETAPVDRGGTAPVPGAPPAANDDAVPVDPAVALAEPAIRADRDDIDDAVDAIMADEGWTGDAAAMIAPLVARLRAAGSVEDAIAMLESAAADRAAERLAERVARASFAARVQALTGSEAH
ncbi:DUF935 domain-containing protein [Sphingomonas sp. SORGH_AS_0879]|uniref:DUF935 domain-containing protein n=1 Tax=Sphingomonas sp. SORGH_AS_0879 TaxID=3041790 RepID=UPI00278B8858|nr:DUF935 family protein [Sphingomonas sp. SORGH_AS_0879]MDQ1229306.1 phage gp29-like protein [Sphingomonas sp. SORGH_AS_0879]